MLILSGLENDRTRRAYARNGCGGATRSPSSSVVNALFLLVTESVVGGVGSVGSFSDATVRREGVLGSDSGTAGGTLDMVIIVVEG